MILPCIIVLVLVTSGSLANKGSPEPRVTQMRLDELLGMPRAQGIRPHTEPPVEHWTGKWFPAPPSSTEKSKTPPANYIQHGGIKMGVINPECDDAKTNLTVDWNFSPVSYTCYSPVRRINPDFDTPPRLEYERVPKFYSAVHYCMNESITYDVPLPTFGPHRPLWPRYGEYKYLPVQRWLHTLEHGGVVMLYHPCAHPLEVNILRHVVQSCLYRFVISPSNQLSEQRPLALLTWGKRLTMSTVNIKIVRDFITQNALSGPEKVSRDGQYDTALISPAKILTDIDDSELCPDDPRDLWNQSIKG